MRKPQAKTASEVLEKYSLIGMGIPAHERITLFSWRDLELLRNEILNLRSQISDLKTALSIFDEPHQNYIPQLACTIQELLDK